MKNKNRIDPIIEIITRLWKNNPDLRLGQLFCNVVPGENLYYISDEMLVETLKDFYGDKK